MTDTNQNVQDDKNDTTQATDVAEVVSGQENTAEETSTEVKTEAENPTDSSKTE